MDIFDTQMLDMVFQRTSGWSFTDIIFNGLMLSVLIEVDGKKTLGEIKHILSLSMDDLRSAISLLAEYQLVSVGPAVEPSASPDRLVTSKARKKSAKLSGMVYRGVAYKASA